MSFDWIQYLEFAGQLLEAPEAPELSSLNEASLRSAASRAYYATFHCALDLATREGFEAWDSGSDHSRLQEHFRYYQPPDETHAEIARELDLLHHHRKDVDYKDCFRAQPENKAKLSIQLACSILENLHSLRTGEC